MRKVRISEGFILTDRELKMEYDHNYRKIFDPKYGECYVLKDRIYCCSVCGAVKKVPVISSCTQDLYCNCESMPGAAVKREMSLVNGDDIGVRK